MILKNKKKFVRSILIIIGGILFINFIIVNKSFSHQEIEYKKLSVLNGDTLWSIAKLEKEENDYYQDKDIRDIVQDIKRVNNLNTADLKVNQVLEIPTY